MLAPLLRRVSRMFIVQALQKRQSTALGTEGSALLAQGIGTSPRVSLLTDLRFWGLGHESQGRISQMHVI